MFEQIEDYPAGTSLIIGLDSGLTANFIIERFVRHRGSQASWVFSSYTPTGKEYELCITQDKKQGLLYSIDPEKELSVLRFCIIDKLLPS